MCNLVAARKQPALPKERIFDSEGFFDALDAERKSRELPWKEVAAEAGVSASTLTRMGQGRRPDVDSLAALARWAGLNADEFIKGRKQRPRSSVAMISTYLRSDPNLSDEAARLLETIVRNTYAELKRKA
jgi:transcriptional regulator with XRE-family HTH domain